MPNAAFRGKGGKTLEARVDDARLVRLVWRCRQLPGQALFQYRDGDTVHRIGSGDVNAYLQDVVDGPFTAKDFRTWGATLFAFRTLATMEVPEAEAARRQVRMLVLRDTAAILGNTPRICERCYVDPRVFEVQRVAAKALNPRQWEQAATRFLKRTRRGS